MFRYPEHPNTNRSDPFRTPEGTNPFADSDSDATPLAANPYEVSANADAASYQPTGFEATQRGRGGWLLLMAIPGILATSFSAGAVLIGWQSSIVMLSGVLMAVAGPLLLGAAACWSVWIMSRYDLQAMRSGAMTSDGRGKTRWAHRLSVVGTLLAIVPVILLVAALIQAMLTEL